MSKVLACTALLFGACAVSASPERLAAVNRVSAAKVRHITCIFVAFKLCFLRGCFYVQKMTSANGCPTSFHALSPQKIQNPMPMKLTRVHMCIE